MTDESARRVANLMIGAAAAGIAYYVIRTPSLRRVAWRLAVTALTGTLPAWFARETRAAWAASGRREI